MNNCYTRLQLARNLQSISYNSLFYYMTQKAQKHTVNDIDLFHLILEAYNWDEVSYSDDKALYGGKAEATYAFSTKNALFEAKFHEPLNMISLHLQDIFRQQTIQFHFMYSEKPELILEWIAQEAGNITFDNYPLVLKKAAGKCEMILLELDNKKMYEVIPPNA